MLEVTKDVVDQKTDNADGVLTLAECNLLLVGGGIGDVILG